MATKSINPLQRMFFLRYAADLRTLAFIFIFFSLAVLPWVIEITAWYYQAALVFGLCMFGFFGAVITHNTIHCPIFKVRWLNKVFQILLSFTYGHPVSAFVAGHNLSHHKHTQNEKDAMRTTKARFRWNFLNQALFFFIMSNGIISGEIKFIKRMYREKPRWFWQYVLEAVIVFGVKIGFTVFDWQKAVLFIWIPHQYAAWGIVSTNYWQHDGADQSTEYNHSRNFTGKFLNYVAFNNGYHTMHHRRMGLHWSLLPEWHEKYIVPHIHPNLNLKSLSAYLFKTCIYPGKRMTYDGKPMPRPPASVDEDWVDQVNLGRDKFGLGAESY